MPSDLGAPHFLSFIAAFRAVSSINDTVQLFHRMRDALINPVERRIVRSDYIGVSGLRERGDFWAWQGRATYEADQTVHSTWVFVSKNLQCLS